ncbi:PP2C family protein-serine/threonine phosphatase [Brevibacillus sp. TJ4]|uniref:PP2C family protein-serine/threonine phosphatase n=1 Tax=Brevibacillus sp. TJ4 TaxID=3234853 RepID=UPI003BA28B80
MGRGLDAEYGQILSNYLSKQGEDELYTAQQLGKWLLRRDISPEELIDLHGRVLESLTEVPEVVRASFRILTEVMIEYGNEHRALRSWRSRHEQMQSEIAVASTMQQALLPRDVPVYPGVEVGLVSMGASEISGDYYNFIHYGEHKFSVTLGDITGKGIAAAMCMSMLKYAMDSLGEILLNPDRMLRHLNRVVERNIDSSMFVTMVFGSYDTRTHRFRYAVAGHEPGFVYRAAEGRFYDLDGQGAALGLDAQSHYQEQEVHLQPGDMLVLLTDGVTEFKIGKTYITREQLVSYMLQQTKAPVQSMVSELYHKLLMLSDFEQRDDYTMIVLRRT